MAALSHPDDAELDAWYRGEHVTEIAKCPGYRRTSRFMVHHYSVLSAFERSSPPVPKWLALHEFEGPQIPWEELRASDETDWARRVVPGLRDVDFGLFRLVRVYGNEGNKAKL